jgi:hypothetical protein
MVAHVDTKQPEAPADLTAAQLLELWRQAERATKTAERMVEAAERAAAAAERAAAAAERTAAAALQVAQFANVSAESAKSSAMDARVAASEASVNVGQKVGERATAEDTASTARAGYHQRVDDELARGR